MRFIPKAGRYTHLILFAAFTFFYLNNLFRIQREYNRLDMVIRTAEEPIDKTQH